MRRQAFTLVELLIAMTLTIILVYVLVRFFSFVGETVRDGRAQTEMGGELRAASQRLRLDFSELTVRVGDRIDSGSQQGCLEIWEGPASDVDPDGDRAFDPATFVSANLADANADGKPDGPMVGDTDDILVMTVRSQGEPYTGRHFTGLDASGIPQYVTIRSNLAEVIWFTTFKDENQNGTWELAEPRYLVRRQLLIRPDLAVFAPAGQNVFHHNDVSCRVVISNGVAVSYTANSLGDLSRRENRCVHMNLANLNQNGLLAVNGYMPNAMQLNVGQSASCNAYSLDGIPQFSGEDKMLPHVMAFDVRVYDPFAVLRADNTDLAAGTATADDDAQGVLSPGDAGYAVAVLNNFPAMGQGAYVDLWYSRAYAGFPQAQRTSMLVACNSSYAWAPNARNFANGAAWDTWTTAYEKDGIQQVPPGYAARVATALFPAEDWLTNGNDDNGGTISDPLGSVDDASEAETKPPYPSWVGTNGVDDDGQNGPDDPTEQIWSEPTPGRFYPSPSTLRGIEVRIRMYEPGTRQTRQATVATDFIPE